MLEKINAPMDLAPLSQAELAELCSELRETMIDTVSRNGGHLASSLGGVELIVALHYVFHRSDDRMIFDVGHQAYAHKLLTGRRGAFHSLRQAGGIAGFPTPSESPFDPTVCGHAGNAISNALGIAAGSRGSGKTIAVVGDGALTCGVAFEGLNAARANGKNLLVILNDNQMSISRNVGAVAYRLNRIMSGNTYNRMREAFRNFLSSKPSRHHWYRFFRRLNEVVKSALLPPGALFEEFGFRYLGPIDGHSLPELIRVLESTRDRKGPHLIHVVTRKGKGYSFAEEEPTRFHGVSRFDRVSGRTPESAPGFSAALGRWACRTAERGDELVAISAAMLPGTGLAEFARRFPSRCYDVGIAEEHAVSFAAGLAAAGKRPLCAIYATFAQRALDMIYHDAVLAKLPVIFAFDRAGVVEDGPTHHGIYDLGFLRGLPGLTVMAPRNEAELELMLDYAMTLDHPAVVRYPRGGAKEQSAPAPLAAGRAEILRETASGPVLWALGAECDTALEAAGLLRERGLEISVVNARFVVPFDRELAIRFAARPCFSLENHRTTGGLASALDEVLASIPHGIVRHFGWGDSIIPHGSPAELRKNGGLDALSIADAMENALRG